LTSCVEHHGLAPYLFFNTRFCEAAWDEAPAQWRISACKVSTNNGERGGNLSIRARVLISGMGALHVPHYPEIPGIQRFSGPSFHSATWRSDVQVNDKRAAVIGTGASAIQFIPAWRRTPTVAESMPGAEGCADTPSLLCRAKRGDPLGPKSKDEQRSGLPAISAPGRRLPRAGQGVVSPRKAGKIDRLAD
jgi:Flavin-binding monooxygenase-like